MTQDTTAPERIWVCPIGVNEGQIDWSQGSFTNYAEMCEAEEEYVHVDDYAALQSQLDAARTVKPLVWDGFVSGPYEIIIKASGIADLYYHGDRDEDGTPDNLKGGYLTLLSIDNLIEHANAHHKRHILSSLEGGDT